MRALLVAAFPLALGACSWFTDFKSQPKYDPWESPQDSIPARGNPQHSVPLYGTAAAGYAVSYTPMPGTVDSLSGIQNPVPADARSLANGRKYYQINCQVCHGDRGMGDGPVVTKGMPGIALVGDMTKARSDGYLWGMMRNGRGLMPNYNRIEEMDRWDVVNYVRGLQGRYAVEVGPVGLPGETGDKLPGVTEMGPTRPSPYFKRVGSQAWYSRTQGGAAAPAAGATDSAASRVGNADPALPGGAAMNAIPGTPNGARRDSTGGKQP